MALSKKEAQMIVEDMKRKRLVLPGNETKLLEMLNHPVIGLNRLDQAREVMEFFGVVSFQFGRVALHLPTLNFLSILFGPIMNLIAIAHAKLIDERLMTAKSATYTTVAWAFYDKPCPAALPQRERRAAFEGGGQAAAVHKEQVWRDAGMETFGILSQPRTISGRRFSSQAYRDSLRFIAKGDKWDLMFLLWESFKPKFSSAQEQVYWKSYRDEGLWYPSK